MTTTFVDVPLGTSSSALQSMINAAAPDTTFRLAAGTYTLDSPIVISQSGVSIVGAGRDLTTFAVGANMGSNPAIRVGHTIYGDSTEASFSITAPASAGDTVLAVQAGHDLQVGDFIYIAADNTNAFFTEIGDSAWRKSNPLRILMAEVTEVNGTSVTIDSPLTFDYDPAITTVERRAVLHDNVLSGFTMVGPYGEADPGNFNNTKGSGQNHQMIMLGGTTDAVVSDVGIVDAISHGITIAASTDLTVTDFYMDGTHNKGAGGNGYAVWIRDVFDSNFSNLHIVDTRHAVLFGGYNTASGNTVHVAFTNRDINFHGGRDQYNTVVVDEMVRNPTEQGYMAWATFFNEGTSYGAPTDPTTNPIEIRTLVATSKGDSVMSHHEGSALWGVGGNDTIRTGAGNDYVNGGSGADEIYASDGDDTIEGDSNTDTLYFTGNFNDYAVTADGATLYFTHAGGRTGASNVEDFVFADGAFTDNQLLAQAGIEVSPSAPHDPAPPYYLQDGTGAGLNNDTTGGTGGTDTTGGTGGTDTTGGTGPQSVPGSTVDWSPMETSDFAVIDGGSGWERATASQSFAMGPALEAMQFTNDGAYAVAGNALDNNMIGNDFDNRMEGGAGADRIFGKNGNDTLLGDGGDDYLDGGSGDDALFGDLGDDTLDGGNGDDVFLVSGGNDQLNGQGDIDTVIFTGPLTDYTISGASGNFTITGPQGVTTVTSIETFVFNGEVIAAQDLMLAWVDATAGSGGTDTTGGTGGTDTTGGTGGTDTTGGTGGTDTTGGTGGTDTTGGTGGTDTAGGTGGTDTTGGTGGTDTTGGTGGTDTTGGTGGTDTTGGTGGTDTTGGTGGTDTTGGTGGTDTTGGTGGTDTTGGTGGTDTTGGWDGDPADDPVWGNVSTAGLSTIGGATWWDRYTSSGSFVMGTDLDAMQFGNQNDADAFGNAMDNNMLGNDGANRLEGGAGDDRIFGREGNDTLLGDGGNDVIEGAGGNDLLYGGAGNDSLLGGNGNDTLLASIGNDTLDGQNDADTALFGGPLSSYGITQSSATTFTVSDATSTVLVKNIETFVFDGQTVSAANLMTAHAAAVGGTGGTDTTGGTGGTDTTGGTGGTDTTGGTGGTDTTGGTGGTDTTGGSAGTDVYPVAGVWSETSPGNAPVLNGIAGTVDYGRMGVSYVMGPDLDHGRFDNDNNLSVWGNALNNDINGNDGHNRIEGRAGNDTLDGYDGNDTIIGGLGNDKLEGDRDNDLLHGGSGNDTLDGGRGNDVFVFLTGGGSDRIADFGDGSDTLWLGVNGVYTVTQALTHAVETGGDVVFTFGADVLRIDDVTVADIQSHITIL